MDISSKIWDLKIGLLGLILLVLILGVQTKVFAAETILTGKVLAPVMRQEPMPFNAIIDQVLVKPGDPVKKNAPLLRFHLQREAERLLQKEITLGSNTEELRGKILELEREQTRLEAMRNKNRQLVASGLGSRQGLNRQEGELRALGDRIVLLRKTIKKAEDSFGARLRELERYYSVPLSEGSLLPDKDLILPSPLDGYVLSVASIFPGSLLPQGATPIVVGSLDPMLIQVPVYEGEIKDIKEGAIAKVEIPSLGNKVFSAKVTEISWVSNDMNVAQPSYFTVKLMLSNPKFELKPGFKAVVRF
ncbi:MAG: efflux RND transporter periplasmic adaptor subunit [Desulfovibrionaceae bacterium]|nr:efflux RND transporter periplasmic adaptor subunit [Desulfovibrionaceae bacterium]